MKVLFGSIEVMLIKLSAIFHEQCGKIHAIVRKHLLPIFKDQIEEGAKLREVPSLEGHVLLKKQRDALEYLKGRFTGRNKEDVANSISMVEALAVKLTQKNEGELIQEKFKVKKLLNFLKQASEDAKKLVNQEQSFACAEIENARAVVLRFGEALEEEKVTQASKKIKILILIKSSQTSK
ncbi:myosin heavy chain-like protein, putative [Medicago truncatula]|uniref:Myosin heavy chain-like protein, putative n=1 Tax=Medicago truncatula TaxID=3880 RepID=G7KL71_MEDTR|nr:myosin heavy chain-like protein, putative [Medicago truncatula]